MDTEIQSYKRYKCDIPNALVNSDSQRTSDLPSSIVRLQGHDGEVFTCNFHPDGKVLLSSGADRLIYIWSVFNKCNKIMTLRGHKGSVMQANFSKDGENIFSCSTDQSVVIWDTFTGVRLRQLLGHISFVNSVNSTMKGVSMLCSGSEDRTVRIWEERRREPVHTINAGYPITSTCFSGTGDLVIFAGDNNDITAWEIRMNKSLFKLKGHTKSITGVALSPEGSYLLSNSLDTSVRIWNLDQSAQGERCLKTFSGIQHSYEETLLRCAWAKDSTKIAAGSADCHVYIWDTLTQSRLYQLPGPKGSVNDVDFHPTQPIIVTATSDHTLYMSEIEN